MLQAMSRPRVLILCTGNSCRSQMGEAWVRHDLGDRVEVHSAGTRPSFVHPKAIQVMGEAGEDPACAGEGDDALAVFRRVRDEIRAVLVPLVASELGLAARQKG